MISNFMQSVWQKAIEDRMNNPLTEEEMERLSKCCNCCKHSSNTAEPEKNYTFRPMYNPATSMLNMISTGLF